MQSAAGLSLGQRLFPFVRWLPSLSLATQRTDLEAGLIGAILVLPQSIALAALAGMPPEYGVYTSIIPVIIAALWGRSPQAVSGPNTAICVLIALAVAPLAAIGSQAYVALVLVLTLMAGLIQLSVGFLRLGAVLDFISGTVVVAIVHAVALVMIVASLSSLLGTPSHPDQPFLGRLYLTITDLPLLNPQALLVGASTILAGLLAKRVWKRYALVIAVLAGSIIAVLLNHAAFTWGTPVKVLGEMSLSPWPFSMPVPDEALLPSLRALVGSAFSIAVLGLMQTIVIVRSLAERDDTQTDTNQEIIAQGLANTIGAFFSSFAGSGSFNRSMANHDSGARTPMAAIYASIGLALLVTAGAGLLGYMAIPAVSGLLVLVSINLIEPASVRRIFRTRKEGAVFLFTFLASLGVGLNAGVAVGILLSLVIYLWYASTPNVRLEETFARDGRPVLVVTLDGNLFFGSVQHVQRILARLEPSEEGRHILLFRTDHLTYMDVPGAEMVAAEARRRCADGNAMYVYVTRDSVLEVLRQSGGLETIGEDHILYRDREHPMKELMFPRGSRSNGGGSNGEEGLKVKSREIDIGALVQRLRSTRLIGPLSTEQLSGLLQAAQERYAEAGDIISRQEEMVRDHILLVQGQLETQRTWVTPEGVEKSYTKLLQPGDQPGAFVYISAASRGMRIRALSQVKFLAINADTVDDLLGWSEQLAREAGVDPEIHQRMALVKQVSLFQQLPFENVVKAFERMRVVDMEAGQTVVTQGEEGDSYYLVESGDAEVHKTDPFTDETECVARLGPGDGFGEESLLQGGYRNATVKMTTPGRLLVLGKQDFDTLVKSSLVDEISAGEAHDMVEQGQASLVDCRYDMEYEDSRIPGAIFMPLDRARWDVHKLDPEGSYIVYCRSGRRSRAAAFLLKERNIKALSLKGGIKGWPFEVDMEPVTVE